VRRRQRRVGGRLLATGAGLIAAAIVATVLVLTLGSSGTLVAGPNSLGVVDPASLKLVSTIPVGNTPTDVAASDDWVWVVNSNDGAGTISRIDAETRQRASTFSVAGTPRNILAAFGSLWVGTAEGRVYRVEPSTDLVERSWTLPNAGESTAFDVDVGAGWLAEGPNVVWAGSLRALSRIDPQTSQLRPSAAASWGPMAYGFGSLWVLGRELERLSPATGELRASVDLVGGRVDVATGFGSVWIADDENQSVLRVDSRQEAIVRTYDFGGSPLGVEVSAEGVWVASDDGTVARIDPETNQVAVVDVGGAPRSVDIAAGAVWVSVD
jgi:DNA-binding beta-propeller fold protein YncE